MRVRFHAAASAEFLAAAAWSERQRPGLGVEFRDVLEHAIETMTSRPEAWPALAGAGARRFLLPRFPGSVVHTVRGTELVVIALAHGERRPGYRPQRLHETC